MSAPDLIATLAALLGSSAATSAATRWLTLRGETAKARIAADVERAKVAASVAVARAESDGITDRHEITGVLEHATQMEAKREARIKHLEDRLDAQAESMRLEREAHAAERHECDARIEVLRAGLARLREQNAAQAGELEALREETTAMRRDREAIVKQAKALAEELENVRRAIGK